MDCIDPLGWSSDYNLVDASCEAGSVLPRISCDGDENAEFDNDADLHIQTGHMYPSLVEPEPPAASFESSIVDGNALHAASVLVAQAAFQSPNTSAAILPLPNIMLFLYLAKLVMSSGLLQQFILSQLLTILYPYADKCEKDWAPIPSTVSGFRSCILNVSNKNSLVSTLPIPTPETLPDGHGYTPFRSILRHALMMKRFEPAETKDPKWKSLVSSKKFQAFLRNIPSNGSVSLTVVRQLAIGLLIWTDGWDTSTGCKSNRSPMHTGTVTLLIVDVESQEIVGISTYPNMGGPGKIDHGTVFRRFQEDLTSFESESSDRIFASRHHASDVRVYTQVMFIVQDQPERRQASGLLGGGSTLHPLFGTSCDFGALQLPFVACKECEASLLDYLDAKEWSHSPMEGRCPQCLGWSLDRLMKVQYQASFDLPHGANCNTPGADLFMGPGRLPSSLLIEAWNYSIDMFAVKHLWLEADVKRYFQQLCINDATISYFLSKCRRHVYLFEVTNNPEEYTQYEIATTIREANENPGSFELPQPPAMWLIGDTDDKTEGIMHLSMGTQKAVFKFIISWATENKNGSALQRRLAQNLGAVQDLKVAYCPCRPYKDEKFGGFTAEGYRAMTMTSPYIYRTLLENNLSPPPPRPPNLRAQKEWTKQDNVNWMYLRGIQHSTAILAPEAKEQVRRAMNQKRHWRIVNALPETISTEEIRDLVWRMYNMFRAIFCTDLSGEAAGNRATASVMRFLCLMEVLDKKLHPKREKPIWIAKFNFLGLLRVCKSFPRFQHVRNLYEGGVIGEGIVKELRPLVAKGVHGRWATNLLLAHYRTSTLDLLIDALTENRTTQTFCPLGPEVEMSKFRRYSTAAEVIHQMGRGWPLPVLLYGSVGSWKAGVIVVSQNNWYFREIVFVNDGDYVNDPHGLTYHRVNLVTAEEEYCFGKSHGEFSSTLGNLNLSFWDYGLMFADLIDDPVNFRYGIVRSGWQYLDSEHEWSEHD